MNKPFFSPEAAFYLDTAVPNQARIFNYLLGGDANFKADRITVSKITQLIPSLPTWVRLRRAFIQEAAYTLYQKGFRQFLDLGSGMPTENHLHDTIPSANIIYSDTNPVAVSYGQSLFAEFVNIDYIYGGAGQIQELLQHPALRRIIDRQDKVAISLNRLPLTLSPSEISKLNQDLYQWAPLGSQIYQVVQSRGPYTQPEAYKKLLALSQENHCPIYMHPFDKTIALTAPWQPVKILPLTQFLGLPPDLLDETSQDAIGAEFHAAFLVKETA